MKKLRFDYHMELSFSETVYCQHFDLKCLPASDESQRVEEINIMINPECGYAFGEDSFGNRKIYGSIEREHTNFEVRVAGAVTTGLSGSIAGEEAGRLGKYAYQTAYTAPGEKIKRYFNGLDLKKYEGISRAAYMMHRLHDDFHYEAAVTTTKTTAEEAMDMGKGVCQDYSHIFIALLRLASIPARYVAGMLCGEGQSHAWVEAYIDGRWYGFDPTNDIMAGDSHIKFSVGRDYSDCVLNRGILTGGGQQSQRVNVIVEEYSVKQ